ncbi:MAG: axeA 7 [Fibrobacteres bacterium]|nr:axeA 7 [Fibrobacterota bacterium]
MLPARVRTGLIRFCISTFLILPLAATAQVEALLWPGGAPGAKGTAAVDKPTITPYPVAAGKGNGAAVVVFPGGGYTGLAMDHEGLQPAKWLNTLGVSAFVVKYRLGSAGYRHPIEMWDGQRAVRWVRSHARQYGIDPKRVGVLGFSAGGHLASTVSTHYDSGNAAAADSIDRQGCRPDWSLLGYPVITMDAAFTHGGSRLALLGDAPSQILIDSLSNEKQVTSKTPPAFLLHAKDDNAVPVRNSQAYYDSLKRRGVAAELKLYEKGGHGFGLADGVGGAPNDPILATWPALAAAWMDKQGFFKTATSLRRPMASLEARRDQDAVRGFGFRAETGEWGFIDAAGRQR